MRALLATILLCTATLAQVPDGWYVYSAYGSGQYATADGGLFVGHPRATQYSVKPITGLPAELTGGAKDNVLRGASAVAILQESGELLIGETGPKGTTIEIHRYKLGGLQATLVSKTVVGTTDGSYPGRCGITGIAILPGGDAVLSVAGLANAAPLKGARLAHYDVIKGTVSAIATDAVSGICDGVAASPDGKTLYFPVDDLTTAKNPLYAVPVTGGKTKTLWTTNGLIRAVAVDATGTILAAQSTYVLAIDPATGKYAGIGSTYNVAAAAVSVDLATGNPMTLGASSEASSGVFWTARATGTHTRLTYGVGANGSGIDVRQTPRVFGAATSGSASFLWSTAPSPTGIPLTGNSGFAIGVDTTAAAPRTGFLVASPLAGDGSVTLGARLHVDLRYAVLLGTIRTGTRLPLPIPGELPAGTHGFFQAFFDDAGAPARIAATQGLRVGVIR